MTPAIRCASPPVLRQIVYVMQVLLSFLARQHREHDGLPLASMSGTSLEQMYIIKKAKCPGLWPIFRVRCTKFLLWFYRIWQVIFVVVWLASRIIQ